MVTSTRKAATSKQVQFPAFAFRQRGASGPTLVMFHASVAEIKEFSTVEHLGPTSKGAQREKKPARIAAIKKFLAIDPQNTIPTALILAFKPGKATLKTTGGRTTLSIDSSKKSSVVVDGQHRLEGIFEFDPKISVPVVALLDANDVETAFQFLVVNNKSSKVAPTHTKALLAKMSATGLAKRLRNAKLSFDAEGINDVDLINTDPDSPFFQTIDWTTTPEPKRIVQATAIELTLDYLSNLGLEDFDDRDIRRSVFLVMWSKIKSELPSLWKKDSRLISKIGILCLSRFIIDRIVSWADSDELDIDVTDLKTIEEQTGKILQYMDSKFWTTKWAEKAAGGFDTAQGRERVYEAITQMYRNGRKDLPWYSDIEILDRSTAK